eukprot:8437496-Pyramimonas_sp.AAC.1
MLSGPGQMQTPKVCFVFFLCAGPTSWPRSASSMSSPAAGGCWRWRKQTWRSTGGDDPCSQRERMKVLAQATL